MAQVFSTASQVRAYRQPGGSEGSVAASRIQSDETQFEIYTIKQTGVIEECFAQTRIVAGLIYVCGGVGTGATEGQLSQQAGAVTYLGRTRRHLTEARVIGDEAFPFLIPETALSEGQIARTYVKGTAGDVLILIYR